MKMEIWILKTTTKFAVAYNSCFGGFALSKKAVAKLAVLKGFDPLNLTSEQNFSLLYKIERHDKDLIKVIEELGESANGECAKLSIMYLNSPIYKIDEYDGNETVKQPHSYEWTLITD